MDTNQFNKKSPPNRIEVELLALDLNTCGRCTGSAANIRSAIAMATDLLREVGAEVVFREIVVETASDAERLRFESSPTVRINGKDIAIEFRESECADCGELCNCGDVGGVSCRVWVWQGAEYLEAPKALFLDALLAEYSLLQPRVEATRSAYRLPDNLRAFFETRENQASQQSACCDQTACCEPEEKLACCGTNAASPACGCQQ